MNRIKYVLLLSKYIKNYWIQLVISIIIHGLYKIMPIALGFETAYIISEALNNTLDNPKLHFLIVLFMVIFTAILNYLDIYISHDVAYRILTSLRNISYERLLKIAPAGVEGENSGNIMSIILEDIEILEWFYAHSIIQVFVAILLPFIALIIIGTFSVWLAIILLAFILAMISVPYFSKRKSDIKGYELQNKLGKLNSIIIDGIQGIKEIIIFKWQGNYFKRMYKANDEYNKALYNYNKGAVKEVSTINLIIGISSLCLTILIIYFAKQGVYKSEMILPLITLATLIYSPLQETLSMSSNYGRIFAAAKRVFDFLQQKEYVADNGSLKYIDILDREKQEVSFNNVSFSYINKNTNDKNRVIKDLSFTAYKNQTTVLVGSSGSGKTTCSKLLQRFWDVDSGGIFINGVDIRDIRLEDLRRLITVVPQEVYLFNKSIKDNLLLANESATDEELENALNKANLKSTIDSLDNGINTIVGERGGKLSGGECQRISIAQAFLRNSPIIILDEITSNLDYKNEEAINNSLNILKKGKITIMIAHSLSTIRNADKIVFIKDGFLMGYGSYEELLRNSSEFKELIGAVK